MSIYEEPVSGKTNLSIIGLGYVGMPIGIAFAKKVNTIGYDNNPDKIELYRKGLDPTKEVGDEAIKSTKLQFTNNP